MNSDTAQPAAYRYDQALPASSLLLLELLKDTELHRLFESYYSLVHIPVAIIDLHANVLYSSRWQRICVQFHRVQPDTCRRCIESDTQITSCLGAGQTSAMCHCKNGLTDCAAPIVLEGETVANVFVGQFLTHPPDEDRFRRQAQEFGFDVDDYLAALREVPVVDEERVPVILEFLTRMTSVITNLSAERKRALEARAQQAVILDTVPQAVFWKGLDARYLGCNKPFAESAGLASPGDIVGKSDDELPWRAQAEAYRADDRAVMTTGEPRMHIVERLQRADGSRIIIDTSKVPLVDAAGKPRGSSASTRTSPSRSAPGRNWSRSRSCSRRPS